MLDPKFIENNPDALKSIFTRRRFSGINADALIKQIQRVKQLKSELDNLRSRRNKSSKEIGMLINSGKKKEAEKQKNKTKDINDEISKCESEYEKLEIELNESLLGLPNKIEPDVPEGGDEKQNKIIRTVGEKPQFSFKPKTHYEIGEQLGILDFERGVRLTGSRFYTYFDLAARLERALINFMLNLHTTRFGYTEVWVPFLVNNESMVTTGQFPKFKGEYYSIDAEKLYLIPTAEVPLVNLYRNEIIPEEDLPITLTAASSCFRREAGAAGKDTRGLVRVHQFQKVELVQIVHPKDAAGVHEEMLQHAEEVLVQLGLPYRVVLLCTGDMSATAAKTYDLEVWMPGLNRYLEISSISNCLDYQARRGMIRFRGKGEKAKPALVHTLNGSGLAAGRTLIAIMENYQQEDGTFTIPEVLKSLQLPV